MVKSCLVSTCKNTIGKSGITFHNIGKRRYASRLKAIGRSADEQLSPQNVVCSKHYAEEDFIFFNGKKYLRVEALPRFCIPRRPHTEEITEETNEEINEEAIDDISEEITDVTTDSQPQNESNDSANINIPTTEESTVLLYTDIYIFLPDDDNTDDTITSQVNVPENPPNDLLTPEDELSDDFDVDAFFTSLESGI